MRTILAAFPLSLALLSPLDAQHSPIRAITDSVQYKTRATVSPDGAWVAYLEELYTLWVVPSAGGNEVRLGEGTRPVWSRSSDSVYAVRESGIVQITVPEGAVRPVATLPYYVGELAGFDARGRLVGSYQDSASTTTVFALSPRGGSWTILFQETGFISDLTLSPTGDDLLYVWSRNDSFHESEVVVRRGGRRKVIDRLIGKAGFHSASFAAGGAAVVWVYFSALDSGTRYVMFRPVDASVPAETWFTYSAFSPAAPRGDAGARWLAMFDVHYTGNTLGGIGLADARGGGGVIALDPGPLWGVADYASIDAAASLVAVCAFGIDSTGNKLPLQVWVADIGRELRTYRVPMATGPFTAELPLHDQELGAIVASARWGTGPITVPGFDGAVWLDPQGVYLLASGVGNGTDPLTYSAMLPPLPPYWIHHFQGVRLSATGCEITRLVRFTVPQPR